MNPSQLFIVAALLLTAKTNLENTLLKGAQSRHLPWRQIVCAGKHQPICWFATLTVMKLLDTIWDDSSSAKPIRAFCVAAYLLLALGILITGLNRLGPDAITYIQLARHYAHGEFHLAVDSWYSPLFSWMLVPGIAMGIEPVLWGRLLQIPAGIGLAWAAGALVREFNHGRGGLIVFILSLLASLIMQFPAPTPDLWHAFLLTWYLLLAFRLLKGAGWRVALGAGVLGGVGYLLKSYSLPFVCAQLAITFGLRWISAERAQFSKCFSLGALSFVTTMVIAGPWIAIISRHDHEFLINSAGKYWTASQPIDPMQLAPCLALRRVPSGRMSNLESMRELPIEWKPAPPFGGRGSAKDVVKTITRNFDEIVVGLDRIDGIGVVKAVLLFCVILIFPLRKTLNDPVRTGIFWAILSILLYFAGYLLVYFTDRYLWPLWGLLLVLCVAGPEIGFRFFSGDTDPQNTPRRLLAHSCLLIGLALLILLNITVAFARNSLGKPARLSNEVRRIASTLPAGMSFASSDYFSGLSLAYWSRGVFLGVVTNSTPEGLYHELNTFGSVTLLVTDQPFLRTLLSTNSMFKKLEINSSRVWAFDLAQSH